MTQHERATITIPDDRPYTLTNDPMDDLMLIDDEGVRHPIGTEYAEALGASDEEIALARKGYKMALRTCALDLLSELLHEGGD
jgi:hypothetical protein